MFLNPPKGMRDFSPKEKILRDKVFRKIERVFQRFGFEPMETPIVEMWDVLKGKYGDEAENRLIWRFKLPYSDKEFALRYDLTVPLARYFSKYKPSIPFKRYQIGQVYRYEDPQRGRYREFYQCDVDVVGVEEPLPDIEILDVVSSVFEDFGLRNYVIRINDRRVLKKIFEESLGVKDERIMLEVLRTIDKLDKIGKDGVLKELEKYLSKEKIGNVSQILETSSFENEEILDFLEKKKFENLEKVIELFKTCMDLLGSKSDKIKIDLSLVRGLDYYTGMIYEVVVTEPKIGSLSGGGRYDNLIGMFAGKKIPAVGGSIGVERLIDVCVEQGVVKYETDMFCDVGIIPLTKEGMSQCWRLADELRRNDLSVFLPYKTFSPIEGIKYFEKKGIKYVILIGKEEVETKTITFQNIEKGLRKKYRFDEVDKIKKEVRSLS